MIRFACPQCHQELQAEEARAGNTVDCTGCGGPAPVPTPPLGGPAEVALLRGLTAELNVLIEEFGPPTAVYEPGTVRMVLHVLLGLFLTLLGAGVTAILVADWAFPFVALIGAALTALALGYVAVVLRRRGWRVIVCPRGFIEVFRAKVESCRWDQVEAAWQNVTRHYYNGMYTGTTHVYTVRREDGHRFTFNDGLNNVSALGDTIQQESCNALLPRALEQYNAGGTVHFGRLSVSAAGLGSGKETLPWDSVERIHLDKGVLAVRKKGKWFSWCKVGAADVPNLYTFLILVDRVVGLNRK